ncbi:MAG: lysophospholipid acyltransferase family protein [Phycisphaerae bacterium]|jgi:hypothetical protein|nr:lysophospholipid acyltransferase family protein [Phycisphaerae bacterium]
MKLSHPIAIKVVSLLVSWVARLWLSTQDIRFVFDDEESDPLWTRRRNLYLFWHETILLPLYTHCRLGFAVLVSRHRDGELIAQVMRMFRGYTVRGSTTRGAVAGLLGMIRHQRSRHLGITPDGPRGPRRVVQEGAVYLASRSGMPLVPTGYAFADCWRAGSWDRMALPRPFRRARAVAGRPIRVPADLDRRQIEQYRLRVQTAMEEVQARAESLAASGRTVAGLEPVREVLAWQRRKNRWV